MRLRVEPALGERPVTGRVNKLPELRIRHLMTVDPEAVDAHGMNDAFLRLMALRTHFEFPPGMNIMPAVSPSPVGRPL